jgi:menaquinol-cytochrome c reductase iron-sulfur subunit
MDRRVFLARLVQFFSGAVATLFALPVFSFIRSSFASGELKSAYPIAKLDAIQEGVQRVPFQRVQRDAWRVRTVEEYVWVHKKSDGTLLVFEPHCTHLGCAYDWDPPSQLFVCPCHGGKFDRDGNHVDGPPPRDLDRLEVRTADGEIRIGKIVKS